MLDPADIVSPFGMQTEMLGIGENFHSWEEV